MLMLPLAATRETDVIDVDGRRGKSFFDYFKLCQSVPDRVSCSLEYSQSAAFFFLRCCPAFICHEVI